MKQCQCTFEWNPKIVASCPNDGHKMSLCHGCQRIHGEVQVDDDVRINNTENEELAVPPKVKGILISEFSIDLSRSLGAILDKQNALDAVSMTLPDLLKEFAIRTWHGAQSGLQEDAAVFVHRYRRYLIPHYRRDIKP
jgi:hypothetical protein